MAVSLIDGFINPNTFKVAGPFGSQPGLAPRTTTGKSINPSSYSLTKTNSTKSASNAKENRTTTSPFTFPKPLNYSRVAKPLSADVLQAFGLRRAAVDEAYKTALAQEESGIGRFRASFEAAKQRLDDEYDTASSRIGRQLAGRGLARSPMTRGRQERELGQIVNNQLGEMQLNLSTEIEGLKQASENARIQRLNLMAQIEQEEALARSQSSDYIEVN